MQPLPMVASCSLDEGGMRAQLARYRRVGEGARVVEQAAGRLVVDLQRGVDVELLDEAIAVERECCPFFAFAWEPDRHRLAVSVSDAAHEPALDAIAFALGLHERLPDRHTTRRA